MVALAKSGGEDVPETIYDDLSQAYTTAIEGSSAALAKRDADIVARDAEIQKLKAMNFESMLKASQKESVDDEDDAEEEKTDPELGINSLFTFQRRK